MARQQLVEDGAGMGAEGNAMRVRMVGGPQDGTVWDGDEPLAENLDLAGYPYELRRYANGCRVYAYKNPASCGGKDAQMTSYEYEVLIPEVSHIDPKTGEKTITRNGAVVARESGVWPEPTREALLEKYEDELRKRGIKFKDVAEVVINIRPFCR